MLKSFGLILDGGAKPEDIHRMTAELSSSASDRSLALVGASLVEDTLERKLEEFLHDDDKARERLFRHSGPLGSFSSHIDLGRLVGVYGDEARKELHRIREIRNVFAHRFDKHQFTEQPIVDFAKSLTFCERYTFDDNDGKPPQGVMSVADRSETLKIPRDRYLLSICTLMWWFSTLERRQMPAPKW